MLFLKKKKKRVTYSLICISQPSLLQDKTKTFWYFEIGLMVHCFLLSLIWKTAAGIWLWLLFSHESLFNHLPCSNMINSLNRLHEMWLSSPQTSTVIASPIWPKPSKIHLNQFKYNHDWLRNSVLCDTLVMCIALQHQGNFQKRPLHFVLKNKYV